MKDGYYYSPDGGEFEVVGNIGYWADGAITPNMNQRLIRCMEVDIDGEPGRYSKLTDVERSKLLHESTEMAQAYECRVAVEKGNRMRLCHSARKKLTKEEYDAVFEDGVIEGRGF